MQASLGVTHYLLPSMSKDGRIAIVVVKETQKSNFSTALFCLGTFAEQNWAKKLGKL